MINTCYYQRLCLNRSKPLHRNAGADGQPCTMVIRTLHWTVPHYSIWGLPFYLFYSTRSSQFIHERPDQSFLRNFACFLLSPMVSSLQTSKENPIKKHKCILFQLITILEKSLFCLAEAGGFKDHRELLAVADSFGKIWTKTRSPF